MSGVYSPEDLPDADFAVIGDPVSHSLSPLMHGAAFEATGLPFRYVAVRVEAGGVGQTLDQMAARGYQGVNVTIPHKAEACAWANERDAASAAIGAANTLHLSSKRAWNTDVPGFVDTLTELGLIGGFSAVVLGAGGSARAVVYALSSLTNVSLQVWNRTPERAAAMVEELGVDAQVIQEPSLAGADLIVNATAASLRGVEIGLDFGEANPDALAYDLAYGVGATPFQVAAERFGLRTVDGRPLLAAQGARSFELWLGIPAPKAVMLRAIQ